jgi:GDP-mannose 6-dehydrogenase
MKVSIFGLGYVGAVSAGCLAKSGHQVIGVDTQESKVDHINRGESPIIEEGIGELIGDVVRSGALRATRSALEAVSVSELSSASCASARRALRTGSSTCPTSPRCART